MKMIKSLTLAFLLPLAMFLSFPAQAVMIGAGSSNLTPDIAFTLQSNTEMIEATGVVTTLKYKTTDSILPKNDGIGLQPGYSGGGDNDLPPAASMSGHSMYASTAFYKDRIPIIDH